MSPNVVRRSATPPRPTPHLKNSTRTGRGNKTLGTGGDGDTVPEGLGCIQGVGESCLEDGAWAEGDACRGDSATTCWTDCPCWLPAMPEWSRKAAIRLRSKPAIKKGSPEIGSGGGTTSGGSAVRLGRPGNRGRGRSVILCGRSCRAGSWRAIPLHAASTSSSCTISPDTAPHPLVTVIQMAEPKCISDHFSAISLGHQKPPAASLTRRASAERIWLCVRRSVSDGKAIRCTGRVTLRPDARAKPSDVPARCPREPSGCARQRDAPARCPREAHPTRGTTPRRPRRRIHRARRGAPS